jgi:DNA modification methylase
MREPYYTDNKQTIYLGDCLDILKEIPDKSFDLVLTDPPYDKDFDLDGFIRSFLTKVKDNGSLITFIFPDDIWKIEIPSYQICVWEELYSPQGRITKKYRRFFDLILWFRKGQDYTFNNLTKYQNRGVFNDYFEDKNEKQHPYQKPLSLIKKLIKIHSNKNDLILDPFMGSGTTLVAAKLLGRKAVGIDISQQYCEIAKQRLLQEVLF